MSFLDLYQGDQDQAAKIQPNEGTRLPSGFDENLHAAWSDGLLFSQSIARANSRAAVLGDYVDEIRQKTGNDLSKEFFPDVAGGGQTGVTNFDQANDRVAKLKADYPDLDLAPLDDAEIDKRAVAKAQATHRTYETLQQGEKTWGGSFGSFAGSAGAAAADPVNIVALAIAPETGGIGILSAALRWGGLAAVSQAAIEASSDSFKEQVQPGYIESGEPIKNIGEAYLGGAVLGGATKALGNAWTRVKTGQWPTSVRDAGNVIESEANVASSNPLPGVAGEVAHREALTKSIDDILAGRPVDVSAQITPELQAGFDAYHGSPHDFDAFDISKIGTGEGAQAYGHGLYFAETEGVARSYRDALGDSNTTIGGKKYDPYNPLHVAAAQVDESGSRAKAIEEIKKAIAHDPGDPSGHFPNVLRLLESGIELPTVENSTGHLYKLRITADKERMIDWDKPLSEQPAALSAFEQITPKPGWLARQIEGLKVIRHDMATNPNSTGATAYGALERLVGKKKASEALHDAGVPGIKYLDQDSRIEPRELARLEGNVEIYASDFDRSPGAYAKERLDAAQKELNEYKSKPQTRNVVLFNDKDVQITHKNGKPVNAETRQNVVDQAMGLPPKQPELPLAPETKPMAPKRVVEPGPQPSTQTPEEMAKTLTAPDHQDAIRADIDRERAMGDFKVPGVDENGNHVMHSVDAGMEQVDAYKRAAEQIQACANPPEEEKAA